jgi:cleavage and polyadenylation specificity factor subunit 1
MKNLTTGGGGLHICLVPGRPGPGGSKMVMPPYTLDLSTVIQTHTLDNIIDIQFLHGYNQPTLLTLYEPPETYAGRIAVSKDTCRLDVVTLDVKEKLTAFIWSREVHRFVCVRVVPVPKPVGGTLVFAVNSLLPQPGHSFPIYGVSLTST